MDESYLIYEYVVEESIQGYGVEEEIIMDYEEVEFLPI